MDDRANEAGADAAAADLAADAAAPFSPLFDSIAQWLIAAGLRETRVADLVQGLGRRLVAGGVPVSRISIGGLILHPVYGAADIVWDAATDTVAEDHFPRSVLTEPDFQNAPFFQMAAHGVPFLRQRLEDSEPQPDYPIYHRLRAVGTTDYLAFFQSYGRTDALLWADLPPGIAGVMGAFATRRSGGFADDECAWLRMLSLPLALAIKAATTYDLAQALLNTYLGAQSGGQVLDGLVERGDGREVDCVLWHADLRGSTRLADALPLDDYLAMLNDYFDCTAGAVLDHGGEVLKFIGDAVLAIFPIEAGLRTAPDMCRAALMAAQDAIGRVERTNRARGEAGDAEIGFAVALHVGQVMYGNVGTPRRLDFTVIGPAANAVSRLGDLAKALGTPLVASAAFAGQCDEPLVGMGTHPVRGIDDGIAVFTTANRTPDGA